MPRKKTTDLTTVPTAATAATGPDSINLLPLTPDRADFHRGEIARLTIPLLQAQLGMVDEMEQNLDGIKNNLQQQLSQLLPDSGGRPIALPPDTAAVHDKRRGRRQKAPPAEETASAKGKPSRKRKATKPAKSKKIAAPKSKRAQAPKAATAELREGNKNQTLYLRITQLGRVPTNDLVTFAHKSNVINPEGEGRAVITRRVSVMLPSLVKKGLIKNIGTPRQGIWVPMDGQAAKPAKSERIAAPKSKRAQAPQTPEVPLREGSQQHILYAKINSHGAEGIPNSDVVDFAVKDKVLNPERETREVIARRISAMLSVLGKKKLIKNIGASRLQGVWASAANLAGGKGKPAKAESKAPEGKLVRETPETADQMPREGTRVRVVLDKITAYAREGIPTPELAEFSFKDKTINPDKEGREKILVRLYAMLQDLKTRKLIENCGRGVWRRKSAEPATDTADTEEGIPRQPSTSPLSRGRQPRPEKLSDRQQRELRQAFLTAFLHEKKRGMIVDKIVAEVRKREDQQVNDTGFLAADKEDDEIHRDIAQFLRMSRHNFACDTRVPEHWWIKEEAPRPFA